MKKRRSLLDWERDAIVAAALAKEKIDAICAEFGVSRSYPATLIARRGLKRRPTGRPKSSHAPNRVLVA
jgi:hypothetical protein